MSSFPTRSLPQVDNVFSPSSESEAASTPSNDIMATNNAAHEVIDVDTTDLIPVDSPATDLEVASCPTALHLGREDERERSYLEVSCHGYMLELPDGQSPLTSYPFGIHKSPRLIIPWSVSLKENVMTLRSSTCSQTVMIKSTETVKPCASCSNLHNNTIIMGIRHRSFDGVSESTPWAYLSHDNFVAVLVQKNEHINKLRLDALNTARKLAI